MVELFRGGDRPQELELAGKAFPRRETLLPFPEPCSHSPQPGTLPAFPSPLIPSPPSGFFCRSFPSQGQRCRSLRSPAPPPPPRPRPEGRAERNKNKRRGWEERSAGETDRHTHTHRAGTGHRWGKPEPFQAALGSSVERIGDPPGEEVEPWGLLAVFPSFLPSLSLSSSLLSSFSQHLAALPLGQIPQPRMITVAVDLLMFAFRPGLSPCDHEILQKQTETQFHTDRMSGTVCVTRAVSPRPLWPWDLASIQ